MTVLDAYAVIAYFRGEPCADEVAGLMRADPVLASGNAAEVLDQLVRVYRRDPDDVRADVALLQYAGVRLVPLDAELAIDAGLLRAKHYHRQSAPVSLADCIAAVTALRLGGPLATSDPALAAVLRAEGGEVFGLPDSTGARP